MTDALYIHVPFCIRKCRYCDFLSIPLQPGITGRYVDALCRELVARCSDTGMLRTVYLGGGTPSLLSDAQLATVMAALRRHYGVAPEAEISIEINPGTIDQEKAKVILDLGINRVSLGVQSLIDDELGTLGRIHTADDARQAVAALRAAGFRNLSLDLIYGIPGQTVASWQSTLDEVLQLAPEHVSAYELTSEEGTPLADDLADGSLTLPDEETVLIMGELCEELLSKAGIERYEISNYSRPGYECRHNLNYWDRGEYIGIGASSHSHLHSLRWRNTDDIGAYCAASSAGAEIQKDVVRISGDEALREYIFLGLRKRTGISRLRLETAGIDTAMLVQELAAGGYVEQDDAHLRLSRRGSNVANAVIVRILELSGL